MLFLGPHPYHMDPRLGVKSELQLPAYATAKITADPSHVCDLCHSSQQHWIPDLLSKARDQTHILLDTIWICFYCATMETPHLIQFLNDIKIIILTLCINLFYIYIYIYIYIYTHIRISSFILKYNLG